MTFLARIHKTDPQNIGETLVQRERTEKKNGKIFMEPKSFRTSFEKITPTYSSGALLLGQLIYIHYGTLLIFLLHKLHSKLYPDTSNTIY